jgi:hypothetical protein
MQVVFTDLAKKVKASKGKIRTVKIRTSAGSRTVNVLDLGSATFSTDLTKVFNKNVSEAVKTSTGVRRRG